MGSPQLVAAPKRACFLLGADLVDLFNQSSGVDDFCNTVVDCLEFSTIQFVCVEPGAAYSSLASVVLGWSVCLLVDNDDFDKIESALEEGGRAITRIV